MIRLFVLFRLHPRVLAPVFASLVLLLAGVGCTKGFKDYYNQEAPKGGYLYEKIKSDTGFSIFARGLERANLTSFIDKGGLYTVFAPTNAAFNQYLSANNYASIDAVPVTRLFQVLSFHIVNNMWYYYDMQLRYRQYGQTLFLTRNKKFVTILANTTDSTLSINGISTIKGRMNIDADNGVIHAIGSVLSPLPNLEEILRSDPQFANSTFYKLMQVTADSTFDRLNSYDIDRDGRIDSIFYKTYPLLNLVYTSIEFRQSQLPESQGGDPVFTTILMPTDDSLNAFIAPALAKVNGNIAALSPSYVEGVLESYFLYDTATGIRDARLQQATPVLRSVNSEAVPTLTAANFVRSNVTASNGMIHIINRTFPRSDRMRSALGQATIEPDLSMFFAALQKAGLMNNYAMTTRIGTYFAPTNTTFQAAGVEILRDPNVATIGGVSLTGTQFSNIVRNHVINLNLPAANLTGVQTTDYANNNTLTFNTVGNGRTATTILGTTANVTLPAVSTGPSNVGIVYKVDQILLPRQ